MRYITKYIHVWCKQNEIFFNIALAEIMLFAKYAVDLLKDYERCMNCERGIFDVKWWFL